MMMSYDISYRRQAFRLPSTQAGHYDDVVFLVEEAGSNNCIELNSRRRARSWECLAAGSSWECLAEATRCAAACCGGSLCLYGHRDTSPETYIRAWRKAIAAAVAFSDAPRHGFHLTLFTRIPDTEAKDARKYAFEQLTSQTSIAPHRGTDAYRGGDYTEWRFDVTVPEQVKLWLETRPSGRGFKSVETYGPGR
jgi:hypothetical protein